MTPKFFFFFFGLLEEKRAPPGGKGFFFGEGQKLVFIIELHWFIIVHDWRITGNIRFLCCIFVSLCISLSVPISSIIVEFPLIVGQTG